MWPIGLLGLHTIHPLLLPLTKCIGHMCHAPQMMLDMAHCKILLLLPLFPSQKRYLLPLHIAGQCPEWLLSWQVVVMKRARMGMQCWGSSGPHCASPHRSAARWAAPSVQQVRTHAGIVALLLSTAEIDLTRELPLSGCIGLGNKEAGGQHITGDSSLIKPCFFASF